MDVPRLQSSMLSREFFQRPVLAVAHDLLGKILVRRDDRKIIRSVICDVEAYDGFDDRACHAYRGKTCRNAPMFEAGGIYYVYFVYGMHWMCNIVTGEQGYPAAVLLRGVLGIPGPARLTKALHITGEMSGKPVTRRSGLWVEDEHILVAEDAIQRLPRVGVEYAGVWARKPYRFLWEQDL